jgi:hypothetical protein
MNLPEGGHRPARECGARPAAGEAGSDRDDARGRLAAGLDCTGLRARPASGLWGGGAGGQGQRPRTEGRAAGDERWSLARALRVVEDDREKRIFLCDAFL